MDLISFVCRSVGTFIKAILLEQMSLPPQQLLTVYKSFGRGGVLWALSLPWQGVFSSPHVVQLIMTGMGSGLGQPCPSCLALSISLSPHPFSGLLRSFCPPSLKSLYILSVICWISSWRRSHPAVWAVSSLISVSFDMEKELFDLMGSYLPVVGITSGVSGNRFGTTQKVSACAYLAFGWPFPLTASDFQVLH